MPLHHQLGCVQHQLQRGDPLLPVDNVADSDEPGRDLLLFQHYRAEEVGHAECAERSWGCIQDLLGDRTDVLPQRLPLVFLGPHVWPLKQRDDVTHVRTEDTGW